MAAADGKWTLGWTNPRGGSRAATIELTVNGPDLSGFWDANGNGANRQPISGKVEGEQLSWQVQTQDFSGPVTMSFEAHLSGERLEGTMQTPLGSNPFSGSRASN